MTETASVVAALVVVAGVAGAAPLSAVSGGGGAPAAAATNDSLAPGERLSGVVGAERAAVNGEVASRSFGQRIGAADSNDSRAAVVGDEIDSLQSRLADLRAQRDELQAAHENGSISQGEYRSRLAQLHAEQRALQRLANDTEAVAGQLPAETLEANGVNVTALQTIRTDAANLTGPEVAALARDISGPNAGQGMGPADPGPPAFVENRTGGPGDAGPGDGGPSDGGPGDGGPGDSGADDTGDGSGTGHQDGPPADDANDSSGDPPADDGEAGA